MPRGTLARVLRVGSVAGFLLLPLWAPGFHLSLLSLTAVYVIAAIGVNLLTGYAGLVSVGHGGFLAVGAYTSALLARHFGTSLGPGLLAATIVTTLMGVLVGLACLRLGGAFLAIATLGFALTVGAVLNNWPLFEGREGISLGPNTFLGVTLTDTGFYYLSAGLTGLAMWFSWRLVRSGVGRAFHAMRDSERAAEAVGINLRLYRTLAFAASAAITGVAGVLYAHHTRYVSAETFGSAWLSVDLLTAVVVGGQRSHLGSALGAGFVVLVPYALGELRDFAFILNGVALLLVLRFAPDGAAAVLSAGLRRGIVRSPTPAAADQEPGSP